MSEFVRIIDPSGKTLRNDLYNSPPDIVSYIIFKEGNKTYAKNGTTGNIEYEDPDSASVIQYTLNNLTSNRTWKETVIIKGNYTINSTITIPEHTRIIINGQLKLKNNADFDMILIENGYVEIYGGVIDGNKANQTTAEKYPIKINGAKNVTISNVRFKDSYDDALEIMTGTNITVQNCVFENCGASGPVGPDAIDINSGNSIKILNNYIENPYDDGIDIEGVDNTIIRGNTIKNAGGTAIEANNCTYLKIIQNCVITTGLYGIWLGTTSPRAIISQNYVTDSANDGIVVTGSSFAIVIGNVLYANGRHGILLTNSADDTQIIGNACIDNASNGINIADSLRVTVVGNRCKGNVYGVAEAGTSDYTLLDGNILLNNTYAHSVDAANSVIGTNII